MNCSIFFESTLVKTHQILASIICIKTREIYGYRLSRLVPGLRGMALIVHSLKTFEKPTKYQISRS